MDGEIRPFIRFYVRVVGKKNPSFGNLCARPVDITEKVHCKFLNFSLVLSPAEFNSLKQLGEKIAGLTSEDQMAKDGFL